MQSSDWLSLTSGRSVELPHSAVSDVDQVVLAAPEPVIAKTPEMEQFPTCLTRENKKEVESLSIRRQKAAVKLLHHFLQLPLLPPSNSPSHSSSTVDKLTSQCLSVCICASCIPTAATDCPVINNNHQL